MKREFYEPISIDGVPMVVIKKEDVQHEVEFWENTLIGYVVGYSPRMKEIHAFFNGMWKYVSKPQILFV